MSDFAQLRNFRVLLCTLPESPAGISACDSHQCRPKTEFFCILPPNLSLKSRQFLQAASMAKCPRISTEMHVRLLQTPMSWQGHDVEATMSAELRRVQRKAELIFSKRAEVPKPKFLT